VARGDARDGTREAKQHAGGDDGSEHVADMREVSVSGTHD
jgi:hypothetical protein